MHLTLIYNLVISANGIDIGRLFYKLLIGGETVE